MIFVFRVFTNTYFLSIKFCLLILILKYYIMKNDWRTIEQMFSSICWVTAISFTICCLYKFGLDKDLCTVTYQTFYQKEGDVFLFYHFVSKVPILVTILKRRIIMETKLLSFDIWKEMMNCPTA